MIIKKENIEKDIIKENVIETKQMRLSSSPEVEAHIVKVLTENYKYPIESAIREQISNHYDANIENGTPDAPIFIKIYENENTGNYILETSDSALGMSLEEFDKYYMGIGESSKRNNPDVLGQKGCGAKAWLSEVDSYNVITRKNGVEYSFLVFKGAVFPERDILYTKETSEPNGVIIKTTFYKYQLNKYINAIKEQTCYFNTCIYDIPDYSNLNDCKIYENDLFRWSEMYPSNEMHISFGPCHYPIEWKILGIEKIKLPIAIKIPITEGIDVHFNRESLVYNEHCKTIILNKIKEISNYLIRLYNNNVNNYNSLYEAWKHIDVKSKYITLADKEFEIKSLEKHSTISFNEPNVNNIKENSLKIYKDNLSSIFYNYRYVGEISSVTNRFNQIKLHSNFFYIIKEDYKGKTVLLHNDAMLTPIFKEYLKNSHSNFIYFLKTDNLKIKLKQYIFILELKKFPKDTWRNKIKEFQRVSEEFVNEVVVDGQHLHVCEDFLKFKKDSYKERLSTSTNRYIKLDKTEDDVVIHFPHPKLVGRGYKFEKRAVNIEGLCKDGCQYIIFDESRKELCLQIHSLINKHSLNGYKCVYITPNEIKKLPNTNKFIMFAKIEKKPSDLKLFKKIATAMLYDEALEKCNYILNFQDDIKLLKSFNENLHDAYKTLKKYVNTYNIPFLSEVVEEAIKTNNIDLTYNEEYKKIEKFNKMFGFLRYYKNQKNDELFLKEINLQLLMRKKHFPELYEELDIIVKPKENNNEETIE